LISPEQPAPEGRAGGRLDAALEAEFGRPVERGRRGASGLDRGRLPEDESLRESYDRIAAEYGERIAGELAGKPLDRGLLDDFADRVRGRGPVCDLGCGPGHVAEYLRSRGVDIFGVDLSAGMVAEARRRYPGLDVRRGDLLALDLPDASLAGAVAFYSLIHVARPRIVDAWTELSRVLRPGGAALVAFHVGTETRHADEMWGQPVSMDFHFFGSTEMAGWAATAGLDVDSVVERDPYPGVEVATRRCYIRAVRPA
jgi:SAM-dependent methyltransferase